MIGLYLRLSQKEKERSQSNSIINQRQILWDYVKQEKLDFQDKIQEFVDDGYAGTTFDRPAIQELLCLAEKGILKCMIVKDLSRFGRNFLTVGTYLEQYFPLWGVRFIAVNDQYDSKEQRGSTPELDITFRSLVNAYYSKELSKKGKLLKRRQMEQGRALMAKPPFGYWKEKGILVPDKNSVPVVERIFQLYDSGMSAYSIAKKFNEEKRISPQQRLEKNGLVSKRNSFGWTTSAILSILSNPVMIGHMVSNKYSRQKWGKGCERLPKENWILVKNTHEPIIDLALFERVQTRLHTRKRKPAEKKEKSNSDIWKGKLFCSQCGRVLVKNGNTYYCWKCRILGNAVLSVHPKELELAVYPLSFLEREKIQSQTNQIESNPQQQLEHWIQIQEKKLPELYEKYLSGVISEERFQLEQKKLREQKEILKQFKTSETQEKKVKKIETGVEKCIIKVVVYEKNRVEIFWKEKQRHNLV